MQPKLTFIIALTFVIARINLHSVTLHVNFLPLQTSPLPGPKQGLDTNLMNERTQDLGSGVEDAGHGHQGEIKHFLSRSTSVIIEALLKRERAL